ncbi:flavin-containing monooxygenase [Mycolicibacterium sp. HS_4_1]
MNAATDYDAVVIGAGFSGMYMLHRLRDQMGLSARVFEAGAGVGGTWYWNRYPGARCDSESYIYCYSFDKDLWMEWEWSERYPEQHEILSYLEHVAERFDLLRDIQFNTRITTATYDENTETWTVTTAGGDSVTARFVIAGTGCLSAWNDPKFPGMDLFEGEMYDTGKWPHEKVDFTGKRVAVIGNGASGIQSTPLIAQEATDLTVFQRTASYIVPAKNQAVSTEVREARKADYEGIWERVRKSNFGFELDFLDRNAEDCTQEEVDAELQPRWEAGGFGIWLGGFEDQFYTEEANVKIRDFLDRKIRERVNNPETAELLVPKGYAYGCKRNPLDSGYYETFNLPHVHLVDVKSNAIARLTPKGLALADGTEYELDAIVFATGFDAMTGALNRIDIRGRSGELLRDKWAAGPRTYLGLMSADYPNLFTITGPQSPSVLSNMPVSIEQHVEYISRIIAHMDEIEAATIEPTVEAESEWVQHNQELAEQTLFPQAATWYTGANVPGKPRIFMPSLDFVGPYRAICDEIAEDGFRGFQFESKKVQALA